MTVNKKKPRGVSRVSKSRNMVGVLSLALLVSCSSVPSGDDQEVQLPETLPVAEEPTSTPLDGVIFTADSFVQDPDSGQTGSKPIIYRGTDRQVRLPEKEEAVRFLGEDVSLNFEQAPLSEVMHAIMGDILGLDYIVDHPVNGNVTLRTRTPVPRDQLLVILESLLKANNVVMIRGSDGRYLVTGEQHGTKLRPSVSNPGNTIAGYSTIIVPLQYISAPAMAEILKPVAEPSAFVRIDRTRNLLMLAGTRVQLDGWLDMIATFDVDTLKGMSVGLFPLENSSVDEAREALEAVLASGGEGEEPGLAGLIRVIPIKRLNSILIVTPRAHYLDSAQKWIRRLDEAHYSSLDRRLFIYPVQNTTASRLAELLNRIYSGSAGKGADREGEGGVAPGMSPETLGIESGDFVGGKFKNDASSGITSIGISSDGDADAMLADVRVVSDDENNALMIYASGVQYRLIEEALQQLDVVATQVIIEASIMEVTLTDELRYGLEWTFKNGIGNDYDGLGVLADGASGPAAVAPGFSYTITNSIGDISAVLNALSQQSLVNIISTPSVMVLDNHEAYIQVGEQVPIRQSTTVTDGGTTVENVVYRDTGVQLHVRPSVNAGGLVTMDIEQSVTDVGSIDVGGNRRFLERKILSRVAVRSSESVVLGGLIRENAANSDDGVPFLHKIPVVGNLFGTTEKSDTRTELVVIITPRALYSESELREVSEEMRSRIGHMEMIDLPAG